MPVVLVHGHPENASVWDELIPCLERADIITLSPPGYGASVPNGYGATADEYRDWLADSLSRVEGPIDLVGHDWGGILTLRIAMERPELVRSWATDCAGVFDPDYVWHDLAQVWQTPGAGEQAVAQILATPLETRAKRYESLGMSKAGAAKLVAAFDETMGRCMLALYRSARQPVLADWGKRLESATAKPGLVLLSTEDHFAGTEAMRRRSAAKTGAQVYVLQGLGHWWMSQDPKRSAATLQEFWAALA
jgi:pimeloyl-ACP methyl ester carboxylesterase